MAKKAGITLKLEGFEELLQDIEAAGRSMDSAVESCIKQSAKTVDTELRAQLSKASQSGLALRMPQPKVEKEANTVSAFVGFEKGTYNPNNLSDGYKALFLNYGTPHRSKHGHEKARNFISKAKKKATPKIKREQEATLKKILERLEP